MEPAPSLTPCPSCGENMPPGASFCDQCGAALVTAAVDDSAPVSSDADAVQVPQQPEPETTAPVPQPTWSGPQAAQPEPPVIEASPAPAAAGEPDKPPWPELSQGDPSSSGGVVKNHAGAEHFVPFASRAAFRPRS
ncbi:MAG: zinc ribbon domain-containing protein [Chloroflexi bacterium]|nr:zinc ribbon domain-containing protein [Chloroflexota bacterium]